MKMIKRLAKQLVFACTLCIVSTVFAQDSRYFLHTVTKGQGLYSISRMYNVTEDEIIQLNPGSEKVIKVGQELKIPHKRESNNEQRFHTIQPGETLYRLSVENRVSVKNICDANPGLSVEQFKAGQVIVIPAPTDEEPIKSSLEAAGENISQQVLAEATEKPAEETAKFKATHTVKKKETIYRICKSYGISQAELIDANPQLRYNKLRTGDVINIPFTTEEIQEQQQERQEIVEQIDSLDDETLFTLNEDQTTHLDKIKAALILPFELNDSTTTEQKKMVEFYQGVLMALEKLKQENVSVELVVLDSEGEDKSIKPLLESDKMKDVNII
ncbi:MAG: LysM peptidoglycan-binding domain-containing protein, partial [Bacteroidaceae bacterium]|nr:LysM peptidoglycan-binding domain-containing protein [Bacteroidaceae bacterium]